MDVAPLGQKDLSMRVHLGHSSLRPFACLALAGALLFTLGCGEEVKGPRLCASDADCPTDTVCDAPSGKCVLFYTLPEDPPATAPDAGVEVPVDECPCEDALFPVCDEERRRCVACDETQGCSDPARPHCDPGGERGACVQCRTDEDCAAPLPLCNPVLNRCEPDGLTSADAGQTDAGASDAGQTDGGSADAGQPDAGTVDACAAAEPLALPPLGGKMVFEADLRSARHSEQSSCNLAPGSVERVYRFTLTDPSSTLVIRSSPMAETGSGALDTVLYLRQGDCKSGAESACVDAAGLGGTEKLLAENLAPGEYFLFVEAYGASRGVAEITFQRVDPNAPGACAAPRLLTFNELSPLSVVEMVDHTTGTGERAPACAIYDDGRELTYQLTFPVQTDLTVRSRSLSYPYKFRSVLSLQESPCVSGTEFACARQSTYGSTVTLSRRLEAGTYFLFVDADSSSAEGPVELTITGTPVAPPPVNDHCSGATPLALDDAGYVSVTGTLNGAKDRHRQRCGGNLLEGDGNDRVYLLETTQPGRLKGTLTFLSDAGYYADLYVRPASKCGVPDAGEDQSFDAAYGCIEAPALRTPAYLEIDDLPAGIHHVFVDSSSTSFRDDYRLELQLVPSHPNPPANGSCATAQPLSFTNGTALVHGTTRGAGNALGTTCSTSSADAGDDVVYSFVAPNGGLLSSTNARLTLKSHNPIRGEMGFALRTACALAQNEAACEYYSTSGDDAYAAALGLTQGGTYYVVVDGSDSVRLANSGPFTLQVDVASSPASNEACQSAQTIAENTSVSGTTLAAANDHSNNTTTLQNWYRGPDGGAGGCTSSTSYFVGPDVAYAFVATADGPVTATVTPQRGVSLGLAALAQCAQNACIDYDYSSTSGADVTFDTVAGETYYLIVDGSSDTATYRGGFVLSLAR